MLDEPLGAHAAPQGGTLPLQHVRQWALGVQGSGADALPSDGEGQLLEAVTAAAAAGAKNGQGLQHPASREQMQELIMLLRAQQTQRLQPLQQQGHNRSRSRRGGQEHRAERGRSRNGNCSGSAGSTCSSGSRSSSRSGGRWGRNRSRHGAAPAERNATHTGNRDRSPPRETAGSSHACSVARRARLHVSTLSPSAPLAKPRPTRLPKPDRARAVGVDASSQERRAKARSRSTRKPHAPSPGRMPSGPTAYPAAASLGRRTETSPVIRSLYRLSVQSAGLRPLCSALLRSDDGSVPGSAARGGPAGADAAGSSGDGSAASSDTDPWFWVHKERAAACKRGRRSVSSSSSSWWRREQHARGAAGAAGGGARRDAEEVGAGAGGEPEALGEVVWPRRCRLWRAQSPTVSQQQEAVPRDGVPGQERPGEARKARNSDRTGTGGVWDGWYEQGFGIHISALAMMVIICCRASSNMHGDTMGSCFTVLLSMHSGATAEPARTRHRHARGSSRSPRCRHSPRGQAAKDAGRNSSRERLGRHHTGDGVVHTRSASARRDRDRDRDQDTKPHRAQREHGASRGREHSNSKQRSARSPRAPRAPHGCSDACTSPLHPAATLRQPADPPEAASALPEPRPCNVEFQGNQHRQRSGPLDEVAPLVGQMQLNQGSARHDDSAAAQSLSLDAGTGPVVAASQWGADTPGMLGHHPAPWQDAQGAPGGAPIMIADGSAGDGSQAIAGAPADGDCSVCPDGGGTAIRGLASAAGPEAHSSPGIDVCAGAVPTPARDVSPDATEASLGNSVLPGTRLAPDLPPLGATPTQLLAACRSGEQPADLAAPASTQPQPAACGTSAGEAAAAPPHAAPAETPAQGTSGPAPAAAAPTIHVVITGPTTFVTAPYDVWQSSTLEQQLRVAQGIAASGRALKGPLSASAGRASTDAAATANSTYAASLQPTARPPVHTAPSSISAGASGRWMLGSSGARTDSGSGSGSSSRGGVGGWTLHSSGYGGSSGGSAGGSSGQGDPASTAATAGRSVGRGAAEALQRPWVQPYLPRGVRAPHADTRAPAGAAAGGGTSRSGPSSAEETARAQWRDRDEAPGGARMPPVRDGRMGIEQEQPYQPGERGLHGRGPAAHELPVARLDSFSRDAARQQQQQQLAPGADGAGALTDQCMLHAGAEHYPSEPWPHSTWPGPGPAPWRPSLDARKDPEFLGHAYPTGGQSTRESGHSRNRRGLLVGGLEDPAAASLASELLAASRPLVSRVAAAAVDLGGVEVTVRLLPHGARPAEQQQQEEAWGRQVGETLTWQAETCRLRPCALSGSPWCRTCSTRNTPTGARVR